MVGMTEKPIYHAIPSQFKRAVNLRSVPCILKSSSAPEEHCLISALELSTYLKLLCTYKKNWYSAWGTNNSCLIKAEHKRQSSGHCAYHSTFKINSSIPGKIIEN